MSWEAEALGKHRPGELKPICSSCGKAWPCPTMLNYQARRRKPTDNARKEAK